jgi:cytochrome c oxidase accessory protein FixG
VDCSLCVQVCPTGIDIRQGLQYECIGCGACADVCDTVMDKMGYAKGLIRYTTQNAMENKWTPRQMWMRLLRPRVQIYTMILVALVVGLLVSLNMRTPFKVDVVRDRASLARITEYGTLENVYRLQIMNAAESEQTYHLTVKGLPQLRIETETDVVVAPAQARWIVLRADIPYGSAEAGSHKIEFEIQAQESGQSVVEKSVFIVPR